MPSATNTQYAVAVHALVYLAAHDGDGPVSSDELSRSAVVTGGDAVLGLHEPNPRCPIALGVQRALGGLDRDVERAVRAQLGQHTVGDLLAEALPRGNRVAGRAGGRRAAG